MVDHVLNVRRHIEFLFSKLLTLASRWRAKENSHGPLAKKLPPGHITRKSAVRKVANWIDGRHPAALIRFGEGEGRLLAVDQLDQESIKVARRKLFRQTGKEFSTEEILALQQQLFEAFDRADVVGITGSKSFSAEHLAWVRRIEAIFASRASVRRTHPLVTHCLVNGVIHEALDSLLLNQPYLSVVSCRNVQEALKSRYKIKFVNVYQVPSQFVMRHLDDAYEATLHGQPIWPEFYQDLIGQIRVRQRGEVFLVGAGLFGKQLCIRIKEMGGIALDIGSRLDLIAGKHTRNARNREALLKRMQK